MTPTTIILDTETTGFDPMADDLLQVSIISSDNQVLFNSYVRPVKNKVWPEAQAVNNITPEMVCNAPTVDEVKPQLREILTSADVIIGYNTPFDLEFLRINMGIAPRADARIVDVMEDFAHVYKEWSEEKQRYKWQKLTKAAAYYSYEFRAHDSLEDARATLFVYEKMNEGEIAQVDYMTMLMEMEHR